MNVQEVYAELLRTRAAIGGLDPPAAPGVYAWFMRCDGRLGPFDVASDTPIYIGRTMDLAERALRNHFKSGSTGWSTLRRTLGAIMKDELALVAIPRSPSRSESNLRHYRFDPVGEAALTAWMRSNLDTGVCATSDPEKAEQELLAWVVPMLNLQDCQNPCARSIREMRKRCIDEASAG